MSLSTALRLLLLALTCLAAVPAVAQSVAIAPHRAVYEMKLASVKNGSSVSGVTGKMLFEWTDVCDGWAVQQHMQMHFMYAEGDETNMSNTIVTWESKDGKKYTFNVRRSGDGKEAEVFKGRASLSDQGGDSHFAQPKTHTVTLPKGAVFPSSHTNLILQKAMAGEKLFSRPVFDGADEDGLSDISAFIGTREENAAKGDLSPALNGNALLTGPAWPVRLAFFKPKSETGMPDYEMNLNLLANGVSKSMLIDYGDFAVSGTLISLEALPPSGC